MTAQQWVQKVARSGHRHLKMPAGMHTGVWRIVLQCLNQVPQGRPIMAEIVDGLNAIAA